MLFLHEPKKVLVLVQLSIQLALCQYNIASGVTDGRQKGKLPTWQAECKSGLPVNLYFSLSILLVFSRLLFCVFFGLFSVIQGFCLAIHIRIHHQFLSFF